MRRQLSKRTVRLSAVHRIASIAMAVAILLACSNNSPTRNTAEMTRELRCREEARGYCAETTTEENEGYERNKCIADRAWNCIMGQTRSDMSERYAPADLPGN
jgi:hypothetical protein